MGEIRKQFDGMISEMTEVGSLINITPDDDDDDSDDGGDKFVLG
jgi:hypothetical protein